jgi:parvulin-like peptidyl-prolyl isomerase
MKFLIATSILILTAISSLSGQMASAHASSATVKPVSVPAAPQASGKPVARVNGAVLTDRDLLREMYNIFPYARQHNGSFPKELEPGIRQGALKMIVFEELVYQDAERRKLTVSPVKLNKAVADFRTQFKNPEEYRYFVKTEGGGSEQALRAKIQRSLLIDLELQQEIQHKAAISLAQAKAYYDKNPNQFRVGETFTIQTISILPPDKATPAQLKDARKKAEDAVKQAKATKDYETFGVLAEKISEDNYRVMMGDHHEVEGDKLPPVVVKVLLTMQPGQVSNLIQFEGVYSVIRLNAHTPARVKNFDEVKDALLKQMQQQKTEQLRTSLDKKLRSNAKVEVL